MMTKLYASRRGKMIAEVAILAVLIMAVALFDLGIHGTGMFATSQAAIYEKVQSDPAFDLIIDSTMRENGTLVVTFHHTSSTVQPIRIIGDVRYDLSASTSAGGETVELKVFDWTEDRYFEIKVGEHSEIVGFGDVPEYNIDTTILDAHGNAVEAEIEFYKPESNTQTVADTTTTILKKGRYDIEAKLKQHHVKSVKMRGVDVDSDVNSFIKIDDVPTDKVAEKNFVAVYAIDPTAITFSDAIVTASATGDELYKCKDWNFAEQSCSGDWVKIMDIVPGQDYSVTLTSTDPAYAEAAIGSPSVTTPFFISTENFVDNRVADLNDFDECPIELNDYGDTSLKCGNWDCLGWSITGTNGLGEYCTGNWSCIQWNGVTCAVYNCSQWTVAAAGRRDEYCSGGYDCRSWNGTACGSWRCTTWTASGTNDVNYYCSGQWNCTNTNGTNCDYWNCTQWAAGATTLSDYYCSGSWNCTNWNGTLCKTWNCTATTAGTATYDYYCAGGLNCSSWNGNVCGSWKCLNKIAYTVAETDIYCDTWNCQNWDKTKKVCGLWNCTSWLTATVRRDGYCSAGYNCTAWKDTRAPRWSNNATAPANPATYSPVQSYQFNVTWTDNVDLDTVLFEHNFNGSIANYTFSGFAGSTSNRTYYYTYGALAAGSYYWKSYANDSTDNRNETPQFSYTVNRATPTCSLTFNPASPQTYGTSIIASCSCANAETQAKLYRNGTDVTATENNVYTLLPAGSWDYVCNSSQTQNYTSASNSSTYVINQAASTLSLTASPSWNVTYGSTTNISCSASTPQITPQLYRNGTSVLNPDVQTLGAEIYSYVCNASATQNYTAPATQSNILTANKANSSLVLMLNGIDDDVAVSQNLIVNITSYIVTPNSGYVEIYENGTLLDSGNSPRTVLKNYTTIGTYNITAVYNATQNYTASYRTHLLTITVIDTTPPNWSGNATYPVSPAAYAPAQSYQFNVTWNDNLALSTVQFEHNFTGVAANYSPTGFVGNSTNRTYYYNYGPLAAGTYYWKSYATDTSGNPNATTQFSYVVNQAAPILTINSTPSFNVTYGTPTSVSCSANTPQISVQMYLNGTPISIPDVKVLAGGVYNYTCNSTATQNYTAAVSSALLTVNKVITTTQLYLNGNRSNLSVIYGTTTNATATTNTGTVQLYRNGTPISNPEIAILAAGYYNYTAVNAGNENYTESNETWFLTINQSTATLTLNAQPSWNVTYGSTTNISCSASTPQITPQLYRNGTLVNNPDIPVLATGSYGYLCNATETQNYTAPAPQSNTLTVNKANSTINLTLNGVDGDKAVAINQSINITGRVITPSTGYIELYDNGTRINSGSSPLTNITSYSSAGLHNITAVYNATQNYTANFETHFINVTSAADTTPPNVTNVMPVAASNYTQSQTVLISANITDYSPISSATAGVSWSNNSESCAMNRRLFYDDFSNSNLTQWTIILGNWTVAAGQVFTAVSESNRSMIVAGDSNWTNYTYYTEVKQNGNLADDLDGVLVFRYVNLSNYYKIEMDVDTAGFHIDRTVNGTETILNATDFTYEANVWYSQKILVNGSTIKAKAWKYGAQEPDWMITATDTIVPSGKVGYTIYSSNATFDNSRVDLLENDGLSGTYDCEFTNTSYIGRYNVTILASDSNSNANNTQTTYFFINDVTPPIVRLMSPGNNSYTLANANFTFNASDNSGFALNCSLYIDSVLTATNQSVQLDTPTTFAVFGITQGLGKIWNVTCIDIGNNVASSARTFNVDISAPSTSITSPTNGTNTSDPTPAITFVSTDNLAASVNYAIFVDGVANGQTGTAANNTPTSINLFQLSQTSHTIVVGATDTAGNSQNSTPLAIAIVPPTVYLSYPPDNAYLGSQSINFTFNVSDPTFPTLNCSLYINGLLNQTNGTTTRYVTTAFVVTGLQQGANRIWNVSCTNPVNVTASDVFTFNIDLTAPSWSNKTETPASFANYSNSTSYQFSVNWTDNIGVANVQIEHNFYGALANYSVNNSGTIYYYNPATLATGNYSWRMYANDSVGNLNQTGQFNYTVNKTTPVLTLTADPAFVAYNGTLTSVGCTANTGQVSVQLYRNGSLVGNPNTATLPAGTYGYVCNSTATQNYTATQTSDILQITTKNLTFCPLHFSPASGQSYPVSVNASCSCTNPETTATLWRNGVNVTATENNKLVALAAGSYDYMCNSTETGNYSYGETASTYVINKTTTTCSLTSNPTSPQTYGTAVNASCSCTNPEAVAKLYRNGTDVTAAENKIFTTLPAGTWFYNCTTAQTQNYTHAENASTYVMNKATPALTINVTPSLIVTYGNQTNASCTANTPQVTPQLYRNGTLASNPDVQTLAAGTYNYTCNAAATQNYTAPTQQSVLLTVNQASSTTQLYLNGSRSNITLPYNVPLNVTASTNVLNLSLYIDNILQAIGSFISQMFSLAAGLHNITAINYGNENYTISYETWFADVLKTTSSCSLTFAPSSPQTYGTAVNASCSCTNPEASAKLYRNGSDVTATENNVYAPLAAGIWDYKCNVTAAQNYTSANNSSAYTIDKAASTLTLSASPSWSETYGTITNISCVASTPQITPQPYRNGTLVSNPDIQTLAASSYSYICTATATQNYTAPAPQSNTLVISKASPTVNLTLSGIDGDIAILPNQNVNITGYVIVPNAGYIELYENGTLANSGQSPLTSIRNYSTEGIRNITVIYNATQNYTASYEMHFINVSINDTSPPIVTLVSPTPANGSALSQNWVYVNVTAIDTQSQINTCTLQFNGTNYTMTKVGTGLSVSCYRNHTASEGTYSYKVYANDSHSNTDVGETRTITIDTTPPASVSGLNEAATGENWIYWNWTNPTDPDFNHTEIWLNGTFRANVNAPANSYNVTGLAPNTTYEIQTRTTDNAGNINTTSVNDTATTNVSVDTTPPVISAVRNGTVTNTTAIILWDTDDFANAAVIYGTNSTNMSSTEVNISYVQNHSVVLTLLTPNTIYYYNITSCSAGGCNSSGIYNFTTAGVALLPDGSACTLPTECLGEFCVHNVCRSSATFCGDSACDSGEDCSSCSTDCGSCGGGGGTVTTPGAPAIPITPSRPPLLVPGESEQISTIEHSEPGHILGNIEFAPAGVAARIDTSTIQAPVYEIVITPNTDIRNSTIEITQLDSIQMGNTVQFIPTHEVTGTVRLQIPTKTYTPDVGEFIYSAFSVEHVGLEGLKEVMFRFKVSKQWISANSIDVKTVTLRRNAENKWSILKTYVVDEDAYNYYYVGISPGLSTFSIVATSPPLLCSICRPGDWSACIDGEQTRLGQDCGSHTGYTCRPIVESRPCETPAVPTPPSLPLDIIIIPIVGIAVGSYVVFSKKSW